MDKKPAIPRVTVLMAVYNGERFVHEAVRSVLAQTFGEFEFLIVNDGSTDSTGELVASFKDPRIRLIDNDRNIGQTKSLNRGLQMASGALIARQDADDISEPERLRKQVGFMDSHPDVALLGTWYTKIDERGNHMGERMLPCDSTGIRWRLFFSSPFVHSSVMLRKSMVLETVGLYDETFSHAQDFDLWCRIARSLPLANLPEHLVRIRSSSDSMTATYGDHEGHGIRLRNLSRILDWREAAGSDAQERRFSSMRKVLFDHAAAPIPLYEVRTGVRDILRLQSAFTAYYKLDHGESQRHRRRLRDDLVRRLTDLGYECFTRGAYADAASLLLQTIPIAPLQSVKTLLPAAMRLLTR